jgi:ubiquinol-cytochrome c reductase iron-sulfur subunit
MRLLTAPLRWLFALAVLASRPIGRLVRRFTHGDRANEEHPADPAEVETVEREVGDGPAELVVAGFLFAVAGCSIGFVVAYVAGASTQLLGLTLGLALLAAAAAAITAARRVVPQEQAVEDRKQFGDHAAQSLVAREVAQAGEGISRRRLLIGGVGAAGTALGAALVVPAASLGPKLDGRVGAAPWRRGTAVVAEDGSDLLAADVEIGTFVTGFPRGADRNQLGAAIVLVKLPPESLHLPPDRADWAPEGILAYSKICTHAGCAINLYRYPLYAPTSPRPALVCPCHYSTFDPSRAGERIFGPAGRSLPQLPLAIEDGRLVAAGEFSGPVGPSWSQVRES